MEPVDEVTMTPCMEGSGRWYADLDDDWTAHDRCPKKIGRFVCACRCHGRKKRKDPAAPAPKRRVVRRKTTV